MSKKRYPIRIPRAAAGIRAQESRAGAGRSWWSLKQVSLNFHMFIYFLNYGECF